jgi:ABC-type amino acid transport substrate-binding protein
LPLLEYAYPETPPRAFTNAQGEPDGFYIKLLRILLARAGLDWRASSFPAPRVMKNLESGESNFSILVRNSILDQCCLRSTKPVWNDDLRAYYLGDRFKPESLADLRGKSLIVISGFSYGGLIDAIRTPESGIVVEAAPTRKAAFEMLRAGRADYALDYAEPSEADVLSKDPIPGLRFGVIDRTYMYFYLARAYPDAPAVLARFERIYEAMRQEDVRREYTR